MDKCKARREPASPQIPADKIKTNSLVRATLKPQAAARFSFSRIASITAPSGEFKIRDTNQIAANTKIKIK